MIGNNIPTTSVVVMGGGTGTYTVLKGLKKYSNLDLTAVVTSADDGGSNKKFRDEFGLLPPSDFRQCLLALADESESFETLRNLMRYRFSKGSGFEGQTFGNILIAALTDIKGNQLEAFKEVGKMLNIRGQILPVTLDNIRLMAEYEDGSITFGEHLIDEPEEYHNFDQRIKRLFLNRTAEIFIETKTAIEKAEAIILGPGDLYTSIAANLVVNGVVEAVKNSKAKIIYCVNLVTKYGQTSNFTAFDHVQELSNYLGRNPDFVLMHNQTEFPEDVLQAYAAQNDYPVIDDLAKAEDLGIKVIRENLINSEIVNKSAKDNLKRSLIRHDSDKLAEVIAGLLG